MIVGNGDIAKALRFAMRPADESFLFFASGVSNSQETRQEEYQREIDLLLQQDRSKHLVYFSSLCIFYLKSPYAEHKKYMESLIRLEFPKYTIIRLGNITWGDNPHTIINFIRNKIKNREEFKVKDEYRYIIDMDEFLHWIDMIPDWNCEMNLPGRRMKVEDIINIYGYVDIHS